MEALQKRIVRLALTGGPCAGKTSALAYLRQKLGDMGFYTVVVPEAATLLINAGIGPKMIGQIAFQQRVFEYISHTEEVIIEGAKNVSHENIVVIHDRGIPDGRAYIMPEEFDAMLTSYQSSMPEVRDKRYDAVFHLRTAAMGAEKFYTNTNNTARYETPEEARLVDEKILNAWVGHPHLRVIGNSESFEEKLKELFRNVCAVLGIPTPLEIERKYLVEPFNVSDHTSHYQEIDIEQAYLVSEGLDDEVRIRKRGQDGSFVYYRTIKRELESGVRSEREEQISKEEYLFGLQSKIKETRIVRKTRTCFVYKDQYFEYDSFLDPPDLNLLEIELTEKNQAFEIPDFIRIIRDVTGEKEYSNSSLARVKL